MSSPSYWLTCTVPARKARAVWICLAHIGAPYRRLQAVRRGVGLTYRLIQIGKTQHRQHRTEDLFLRDAHVAVHLIEQRRRDVIAAAVSWRTCWPPASSSAPPILARIDIAHHRLQLGRIDNRPHHGRLVERIARLETRHHGQRLLDEALLDRFLHKQARRRIAALALIEVDRTHRRRHRRIQVGRIGADDIGRLAAQLGPAALEIRLPGHLHDLLAHAGRTGEGDAVHLHMQRQRAARLMGQSPAPR